jgi:hypothetical protein
VLPIADPKPVLLPSERDPILLPQRLNPASDSGPNLVAFVIVFGFKGGSPLLCSLGGTASVTSFKVPCKNIDGFFFCWNPHCVVVPLKSSPA